MVWNRMFGYWTGSKLAKINPHMLWGSKWFNPGTPHLKRALHLVVLHAKGDEAYEEAYIKLPKTHRAMGLSQVGCAGTFLGSDDAIDRYFKNENLKKAIQFDFEIPIDRIFKDQEVIEFLTHTAKDVRDDTLFLVFDEKDGIKTNLVRKKYPKHIFDSKPTLNNTINKPVIFTNPTQPIFQKRKSKNIQESKV